MTKKFPSIQVINRASSLLEAITRDEQPVSLKVLAADTGLHPATAFRILGALAGNGLTQRDERGRYRIGAQLSAINARADLNNNFCRAAERAMDTIAGRLGCSVELSTRDRDYLVPVLSSSTTEPRLTADQPQRYATSSLLHHSGGGRLVLANAGRRNFERYIRRARCHDDAGDVQDSRQVDQLWLAMEQEKQREFARDINREAGVAALSAIVDPDDMWRTLCISMTFNTESEGVFDEAQALDGLRELIQHVASLDHQANDLRPQHTSTESSDKGTSVTPASPDLGTQATGSTLANSAR